MDLIRQIAGIVAIVCGVLLLVDFLLPKAAIDIDSGRLFVAGLVALLVYVFIPHVRR